MEKFSDKDYWKGIILYGLNAATYKIALGKTLLTLAEQNNHSVSWNELSKEFLDQYINRLAEDIQPQMSNPTRLTVMERIVMGLNNESLSYDQALTEVSQNAFNDVIPRFHSIGKDKDLAKDKFYEVEFGKRIILKDSLFSIEESDKTQLLSELDARWSLLEGAFSINRAQYQLANDIRDIYIQNGYERKNITSNIPFLDGYQNNTCFYCSSKIEEGDIHVDHVLPRQVINHDEIWNLVLSHSTCNLDKSDKLVGLHYIEKLYDRNENIMGSNHPWKNKIQNELGKTPNARKSTLLKHYDNVRNILGDNYWGGIESYSLENDTFYRSLITMLNKR